MKIICLFLALPPLAICVQVFCACSQWGLLSNCCAQASPVLEHGLWIRVSSVDVAHGLSWARCVLYSWPRDQTRVPCIDRQIVNHWTTTEDKTRSPIQYQSDSKIYLDIWLALSITRCSYPLTQFWESIVGNFLYMWARQNRPQD